MVKKAPKVPKPATPANAAIVAQPEAQEGSTQKIGAIGSTPLMPVFGTNRSNTGRPSLLGGNR